MSAQVNANTAGKPTILLIHGAWHTPSHFGPLVSSLTSRGFETASPFLPTVERAPNATLFDDASLVKSELERLVETDEKEVVVLAHSYGGAVAGQAIEKRFAVKQRKEEGKKGGVREIIYMAAFIIEKEHFVASVYLEGPPAFIEVDGERTIANDPGPTFYNSLPTAEHEHWASFLRPHTLSASVAPLTHSAHLFHPMTYVFCEDDRVVPYEIQKSMVERAEKEDGVVFERKVVLKGDHSPFLSDLDKLVEVIVQSSRE